MGERRNIKTDSLGLCFTVSTIKNVHSPSGMHFSTAGTRLTHLRDCPKCKYGTIDHITPEKFPAFWECADCKARFTEEEIKKQK
jgi:uncharacterized protein YcsI (UPF0317 family)